MWKYDNSSMRLIALALAFSLGGSIAAAQPVAAVLSKDLICVTRKGNVGLKLWKVIRQELEGKGGESYAIQLKGAQFPQFPATLVTAKPGEYLVSITDGKTPEALLLLTKPWPGKPLLPGAELRFVGTGVAVQREPFRLVLDVDPAHIEVFDKPQRDTGTICECFDPKDPSKTPR